MREIIILRGLPASGKTRWAREYMTVRTWFRRVSKDDIRAMIGGAYSKRTEQVVCAIRDETIRALLMHGHSVIVDDTNINPKHISDIEELFAQGGPWPAVVQVVDIETPLEVCIRRDAERERPVGAERIREMAAELEWERR